jgi:hypothetical protein
MQPKIVASVAHRKKPLAIIHFESEARAHEFMDNLKNDESIKKDGIIKLDLIVHHPELGETVIRTKSIKD